MVALDVDAKRQVAELWIIFLITFCLDLRGVEMLLPDLAGCRRNLQDGREHGVPQITVALYRRFKGLQ